MFRIARNRVIDFSMIFSSATYSSAFISRATRNPGISVAVSQRRLSRMRDACPRGPIQRLLFQAHLFPRTVGFSALTLKFPAWPRRADPSGLLLLRRESLFRACSVTYYMFYERRPNRIISRNCVVKSL